jgi:hypothetical protein
VTEERETMPAWKRVWRASLPHISTQALEALRDALLTDDKRLLQGATTQPPPLQCVRDVRYLGVPRFPAYLVGEDGSLWTRHIRGAKGKRLSDTWLKANEHIEKSGYIRDSLHRPGEFRRVRRQQIVLETFVGPCPPGMEACHENDVKTDNRLCNLSWGTRAKNVRDAHRNGRMASGADRPNAKLNAARAQLIREQRAGGAKLSELAKSYGVSIGTIRQVLSNKTYKPSTSLALPEPVSSEPVEAACLWGYCGWADLGPEATVAQVETFFAHVCFEVDQTLGEPAVCRMLLNAYDEWPRDEMVRNMLPEINLALRDRLQNGGA